MRKLPLLLLLFSNLPTYSQDYKDTTFTINGYKCDCKYRLDIRADSFDYRLDYAIKPAEYPGGDAEWKKFLKKNMDKSFKGKDKVEVRFEIDKDGNLSKFELMSRSPVQKYQEVVRLLKLSGKWFPNIWNGFCMMGVITRTFEL